MLHCIVTASASELAEGDLEKFLKSISRQSVQVVLILRGVDEAIAKRYLGQQVSAVLHVSSGGIATVRNIGLRHLHSLQLPSTDVVSFPDDDCRYPDGLVDRVISEFERTDAELLVGSYGESPVMPEPSIPLSVEDAAFRSSSVALFARWSLIRRVGGFNESLGVGSGVFGYGEDNDFALRAYANSSHSVRNESLRIWHLEERPTTGRNPKGYLTSCWLNKDIPGIPILIARGISASLLQDMQQFPSVKQLKHAYAALEPAKLKVARASRSKCMKLFSSQRFEE